MQTDKKGMRRNCYDSSNRDKAYQLEREKSGLYLIWKVKLEI